MNDRIREQLLPTNECSICQLPFGEIHVPVALPCRHIFGHDCIIHWVSSGHGNVGSCPLCRQGVFIGNDTEGLDALSAEVLWSRICQQCPTRFLEFISKTRKMSQSSRLLEPIHRVIIPALTAAGASKPEHPFTQASALLHSMYHNTGLTGVRSIAVPLMRLLRMMEHVLGLLPPHLHNDPQLNLLIWKANACIGIGEENIKWSLIEEVSMLATHRHFLLLHLYTSLISQSIAHNSNSSYWPTRRHERMNIVVEICCNTVGSTWDGVPSNLFKDRLVVLYDELKRHQLDMGRVSLKGRNSEEHLVRGLWQVAGWKVKKNARR